jgi:hypothetical protein
MDVAEVEDKSTVTVFPVIVVGESKLGAAICYPQIIEATTGGYAALDAGIVTKTFFVPAPKLTKLPELLEDKTVVLANVVPEAVYVPMPTSQLDPD